jgi:3',5'-cyclic AMP phosphodiesterase CpdA
MHHSPFSSNLEHIREIPTRLRKDLVPMLEKYKVKLMLSGHLHMYERSEKDGITYMIAGPSGGINNVISYKNPFSVFIRQFTTTFSVLKVLSDRIEVLTYEGARGTVIDAFAVKLD